VIIYDDAVSPSRKKIRAVYILARLCVPLRAVCCATNAGIVNLAAAVNMRDSVLSNYGSSYSCASL
jgi:hypothetical protein